jgi:hypothetical protein
MGDLEGSGKILVKWEGSVGVGYVVGFGTLVCTRIGCAGFKDKYG